MWRDEASEAQGSGQQVVVDVTDTLAVKKKAVEEYRSQVTLFSRRQSRPVLDDSFLKAFLSGEERFLR